MQHPFPIGTRVRHSAQRWARTATATITDRRGPYQDGSYKYAVTTGQDFSRRIGPDNPEDHRSVWSSRHTEPANG